MHPTVKIAVRAAYKASDIILRHYDKVDELNISRKEGYDFVSEVDKKAEQLIIDEIKKFFPTHNILAEESGETIMSDGRYQWIIDPLDGTANYLHGLPYYSISIAMLDDEVLTHAVVYDPFNNELFYATKGQGAFIDSDRENKRIRVTTNTDLTKALIGTGFPFKKQQHLACYLKTFKAVHLKTAGIRRIGSTALDLAYLAKGRIDGFWEMGLNKWNIAAGVLLVTEAGGFVGDFAGGSDYFTTGNIAAGNKSIFQDIIHIIKPHLKKDLLI